MILFIVVMSVVGTLLSVLLIRPCKNMYRSLHDRLHDPRHEEKLDEQWERSRGPGGRSKSRGHHSSTSSNAGLPPRRGVSYTERPGANLHPP